MTETGALTLAKPQCILFSLLTSGELVNHGNGLILPFQPDPEVTSQMHADLASTSYDVTVMGDDSLRLNSLGRQENVAVTYLYPTILAIGLIGNTLSFFVILKSSIVKSSTGVFLAALSCADSSALIQWVLVWWRRPIRRTPEYVQTCNVRQLILVLSTHFGALCVIAVTVDRFVAVYFPLKANIVNTRKRAIVVLIVSAVCFLAIYAPLLVSMNPNCTIKPEYALYANKIVFIFSLICYTYGPIIILFSLNVAIICKLGMSAKLRKRAHSWSEGGSSQSKIVASVLAVSILYTLCQVPYSVLLSLRVYAGYSLPRGQPMDVLINASRMLTVVNNSVNFFLYILTSSNFRATLRQAAYYCFCPRRTEMSGAKAGNTITTRSTSVTKETAP